MDHFHFFLDLGQLGECPCEFAVVLATGQDCQGLCQLTGVLAQCATIFVQGLSWVMKFSQLNIQLVDCSCFLLKPIKLGVINDPLSHLTIPAGSDFRLLLQFWDGRTTCMNIVITTGRDCGRPRESTRQVSSMMHLASSTVQLINIISRQRVVCLVLFLKLGTDVMSGYNNYYWPWLSVGQVDH